LLIAFGFLLIAFGLMLPFLQNTFHES